MQLCVCLFVRVHHACVLCVLCCCMCVVLYFPRCACVICISHVCVCDFVFPMYNIFLVALCREDYCYWQSAKSCGINDLSMIQRFTSLPKVRFMMVDVGGENRLNFFR